MSQYLRKWELIPEAIQGLTFIHLTGSDEGDVHQRVKIATITDADAEALFNRKDGRGKVFVRPVSTAAPKA